MTMKTFFLLLFSLLSIGLIEAQVGQVGINTNSPEGVLHVKSDPLSTGKGVLVDTDGKDGILVAIDDERHPSASVSLGGSNKAFMPNLVALTDARGTGTGVNNPIKNPVDGMIVYNTNRAGEIPDNVTPGLYTFNASRNRWMYCLMEESTKELYIFTLEASLPLKRMVSYSDADFLNNYSDALVLSSASTGISSILEMSSESAYAVALNLSGSIPNSTGSNYLRMVVYVAIALLNSDGTKTILDVAEINPAGFNGSNRMVTYPLTLGFNAKRGDRISILISSLNTGPVWTLLPGRTSVAFWKV